MFLVAGEWRKTAAVIVDAKGAAGAAVRLLIEERVFDLCWCRITEAQLKRGLLIAAESKVKEGMRHSGCRFCHQRR